MEKTGPPLRRTEGALTLGALTYTGSRRYKLSDTLPIAQTALQIFGETQQLGKKKKVLSSCNALPAETI